MISLERFASIRAAIEIEEERDAVLDREGLLARQWQAIERHWLSALASEVSAGGTALAKRYLAAFDRSIGPDAPSVVPSGIREPQGVVAAAPVTLAAPAPVLAPPAPRAPAMPSYMIGQVGARLVAAPSPPAVATLAAPTPLSQTTATPQTDVLDDRLLRRPAFPFAPAEAAILAVSLPNSQTSESPGAGMTMAIGDVKPSTPAVPFAAEAGRAASPPARAVATSREASGTVLADEGDVLPAPPAEPGLPLLNVEQYAWVVATLRRAKGADIAAALARLRLTEASRVQLDAVWRAHMARHPAVKQVFIRALAEHLTGPS